MTPVEIFTTIIYDLYILRKCNVLHFVKFSISFRTFDIFLLLASQQSLNCKNRTIFAVSISMRQKRKWFSLYPSPFLSLVRGRGAHCRKLRERERGGGGGLRKRKRSLDDWPNATVCTYAILYHYLRDIYIEYLLSNERNFVPSPCHTARSGFFVNVRFSLSNFYL